MACLFISDRRFSRVERSLSCNEALFCLKLCRARCILPLVGVLLEFGRELCCASQAAKLRTSTHTHTLKKSVLN